MNVITVCHQMKLVKMCLLHTFSGKNSMLWGYELPCVDTPDGVYTRTRAMPMACQEELPHCDNWGVSRCGQDPPAGQNHFSWEHRFICVESSLVFGRSPQCVLFEGLPCSWVLYIHFVPDRPRPDLSAVSECLSGCLGSLGLHQATPHSYSVPTWC